MNINFHGLLSLALVSFAIAISIVSVLQQSVLYGLFYLLLLCLIAIHIIKGLCAICPSRNSCGHLIPGFVAKTVFPKISPRPFLKAEFIVLVVEIVLIISIPQYWLFKNSTLFIMYWFLFIVAGVEILLFVCRKCKNEYCPSNKSFKGFAKFAQK